MKKIFSIVTLIIMLTTICSNFVLAYNPSLLTPDTTTAASTEVKTIGQKILGIVQIVGTTASIITLIILGIKYMMGSVEEKAEYKKTLMPYLIGAVFVLAAVNITTWIYDASKDFFNETTGGVTSSTTSSTHASASSVSSSSGSSITSSTHGSGSSVSSSSGSGTTSGNSHGSGGLGAWVKNTAGNMVNTAKGWGNAIANAITPW